MPKDISVRITDEIYTKLKAAAGADKRSISSYVALLLEAHLAELESAASEAKPAGKAKGAKTAQ